jgi:nucleotide-binding universal stress UspA family protein
VKILLAVDGSECSTQAVDYLIKLLGSFTGAPDLHVLNVQPPVPGRAGAVVGRDAIEKYHQEEAIKQLQTATDRLNAAKLQFQRHIGIGEPAETIAGYARDQHCDQIVMGTRGLGKVSGLVLGSVATRVIQLSPVPVLLVK